MGTRTRSRGGSPGLGGFFSVRVFAEIGLEPIKGAGRAVAASLDDGEKLAIVDDENSEATERIILLPAKRLGSLSAASWLFRPASEFCAPREGLSSFQLSA